MPSFPRCTSNCSSGTKPRLAIKRLDAARGNGGVYTGTPIARPLYSPGYPLRVLKLRIPCPNHCPKRVSTTVDQPRTSESKARE